MKLSDFKFVVPKNLIAEHPLEKRDQAKMMVLNRSTKSIDNKIFKDITSYFNEGDVLVINNTKVFPARLFGSKEKTDAQIEVFLLRELDKKNKLWDVIVDPARKVRIGNKIYFPNDLVAEVIDNTTSRGRRIGGRGGGLRCGSREVQVKGRSVSDLAPDIDAAAAGGDDPEDGRQAEARAFMRVLGGKEGLE